MAGLELEPKQSSPRSHVPRLYTASLFCPNIWKLTEIAAPEPESRPRRPPLRFRSDPKEAFGEPSRVASLAAASSHPCAYAQPRPSWREETGQDSEGETALLLTSGPSSSSISEAPARNTRSRAAAATVAAAAIPRSLTSGSCQANLFPGMELQALECLARREIAPRYLFACNLPVSAVTASPKCKWQVKFLSTIFQPEPLLLAHTRPLRTVKKTRTGSRGARFRILKFPEAPCGDSPALSAW